MNEQTRYRLTGAVFLLAIAIIVLPMVFDGEGVRVKQLPVLTAPLPPAPSDEQLTALKIPQDSLELHREEMVVASELIDEDGFSRADGTKLGDPALQEVIELAEPESAAIAATDVDEAKPATQRVADAVPKPAKAATTTSTSTPTTTPAPRSEANKLSRTAPPVKVAKPAKALAKRPIWAVQLASFASLANATDLRDKLLKDGFEAWTSTAKAGTSVRTRVAIGPLLDRRDAERMRDLVSGRYKVSAIVVHMTP